MVSSPARTIEVFSTGSRRAWPPAATAPATVAVRSATPAWGSHTGHAVTACGTATEAPQAKTCGSEVAQNSSTTTLPSSFSSAPAARSRSDCGRRGPVISTRSVARHPRRAAGEGQGHARPSAVSAPVGAAPRTTSTPEARRASVARAEPISEKSSRSRGPECTMVTWWPPRRKASAASTAVGDPPSTHYARGRGHRRPDRVQVGQACAGGARSTPRAAWGSGVVSAPRGMYERGVLEAPSARCRGRRPAASMRMAPLAARISIPWVAVRTSGRPRRARSRTRSRRRSRRAPRPRCCFPRRRDRRARSAPPRRSRARRWRRSPRCRTRPAPRSCAGPWERAYRPRGRC